MSEPTTLRALADLPQSPVSLAESTLIMFECVICGVAGGGVGGSSTCGDVSARIRAVPCNCVHIVSTVCPRQRCDTDRVWAHERTELIAMDVFERAQDAGETITRAMVDHRLDELRFARQVGQGPRDD